MSGCGSAYQPIDGIYKSKKTDPAFEATVDDKTIKVEIVSDGERYLYWLGTAPETTSTNFMSDADSVELDKSLMGSQARSKRFRVDGNTISFEFKALGSTKKIEVSR